MFYRLVRILGVSFRSLFKKKLAITEVHETQIRVWPTECDRKFLNQATYFFYLELGRWDWIVRTGLGHSMVRHQLLPVVAEQSLRHHASLRRLELCVCKTELLTWDESWIYFRQTLSNGSGLPIATAIIRGVITSKSGRITTEKLFSIWKERSPKTANSLEFSNPPELPKELKTMIHAWNESMSLVVKTRDIQAESPTVG